MSVTDDGHSVQVRPWRCPHGCSSTCGHCVL